MKVITLITALCFCFSAEAVDISISVRFPSGNPIPNAVIEYVGSDGIIGAAITDLDGNVVLTGLTIMTTYEITAIYTLFEADNTVWFTTGIDNEVTEFCEIIINAPEIIVTPEYSSSVPQLASAMLNWDAILEKKKMLTVG